MHPLSLSPDIQPYVSLLAAALRRGGVTVEEYRTIEVLLHPPDIIHIHWPEHALNRPRPRRWVRGLVLLTTLGIARFRGAALVLTAHNTTPHDLDLDRFGVWFMRTFDRLVDGVLLLSRGGWAEVVHDRPGLARAAVAHTRHGTFAPAYPAPLPRREARQQMGIDPDATTVVFAGQLRRYKGVPDLLDAARELDVQVIVAGACSDSVLRAELEDRAREEPRIHLRLGHLASSELALVVSAASAVVLPYRQVLNSGSAILALALSRPVILPDTSTFRELRAEVGRQWVRLFSGTRLTSENLRVALTNLPDGSPDLSLYDWNEITQATIEAYRRARDVGRKLVVRR